MTDTDGHIGTLLANLQSMRHLTTLETRLLQIQDEYQLLREFANSATDKQSAQGDLTELIDHLKEQLVLNKVPLPDTLGFETQQSAFAIELLTKQFEDLVAELQNADSGSSSEASTLRRLDELIFTEASASSVISLGVLDLALKALDEPVLGKNGKAWLRLLAILTAFQLNRDLTHSVTETSTTTNRSSQFPRILTEAGKNHPKKDDIIQNAVQFTSSKDVGLQELGVWILANFSDASTIEEQAMLGQRMLVVLVPIVKNPKSNLLLHHALRSLTNLAVDAANRKVIDAWFGVDLISNHLDSNIEAIQEQTLWLLSHLASEQLVPSFEKSTNLVKKICSMIKTGGSHNLMASAWRFVANLLSVPSLRQIIINQGIFDIAQQVIVSELEEIETDQERDLAMLQEAVACIANLIAREETLRDAVSGPLLHNLMRLTGCNSAATRAQSVWCLAYMSVSDKNHSRILNDGGLESALDLLEGEEQEQHAAAWLICNFASNPELHDRLRDNGALIPLVKLLFSKSQDVRLVAGKALSRLSATSKNKTLVRQLFSTLSLKDDVLTTTTTSTGSLKG